MIFDFGMYVIDIDVEKTAAYHQKDSRITCDCLGCRNFDGAVRKLPLEILGFFEKLGVDPAKPEVLSIDYAPSKETMAYSGFYYLCGTVMKGEDPWKQVGAGAFQLDEKCLLPMGQDFAVYFAAPRHGIVDPDFPKPILELQFICTLPWTMEQLHHYHNQL